MLINILDNNKQKENREKKINNALLLIKSSTIIVFKSELLCKFQMQQIVIF